MITKKCIYLLLFTLVLTMQSVTAQEQNTAGKTAVALPDEKTLTVDTEPVQQPELNRNVSSFSVWDVVRMLLVLGAVLGVIYLLFFLLKKAARPVRDSGSVIDVIATRSITGNSSVHLLKVGKQVFLVGSGDGNVRLISEITDKETLDTIELDNVPAAAGNKSFSSVIKDVFQMSGGGKTPDAHGRSFIKQQKDRLKNM